MRNIIVAHVHDLQAADGFRVEVWQVVVGREEDCEIREEGEEVAAGGAREGGEAVEGDVEFLEARGAEVGGERGEACDVVVVDVEFFERGQVEGGGEVGLAEELVVGEGEGCESLGEEGERVREGGEEVVVELDFVEGVACGELGADYGVEGGGLRVGPVEHAAGLDGPCYGLGP